MKTRLAKALSSKGYCSRRNAEKLILTGRVKVNGIQVREVVSFVSDEDKLQVEGFAEPESLKKLWIYHKPKGLITTYSDPLNRNTVFQNFPLDTSGHLVSVGRLDINSEGLLLMTTCKTLAHNLEHPENELPRVYKVRTFGDLSDDVLQIKHGIIIKGIKYKPIEINVLQRGVNSWLEMTLFEGKNREIRKILEHFALQVNRLIRTNYGPFSLGDLKPGQAREVSINKLKL
jgi:23S rRNA pseudouridine2605 synthase